MSTLSFAGEMARLQRDFTESHDAVVRRSTVLDALNLRTGERVLELGCGGGYYTHEVAQLVGRRVGSALLTSAPIRYWRRKLAAPNSLGSIAARQILRRRRTGTRSLMSSLRSRRSSICRISTLRCATSIGFSVPAGG